MPIFDKAAYDAMLWMVDGAATANEKGETFENVTQYVLSTLNGVEVMGRDVDMPSEEIDLLLWNAQVEEVLRPWDGTILVECKNWTAKVAAPQLDSFISKMRRRSLKNRHVDCSQWGDWRVCKWLSRRTKWRRRSHQVCAARGNQRHHNHPR